MKERLEPRFFPVEDVAPASRPLDEVPFVEGIHQTTRYADLVRERSGAVASIRQTRERLRADPDPGWERFLRDEERRLAALPDGRPVEACSCHGGRLVCGVDDHALVATLDLAFRDHRPVVLSPDAIWLTICQGLAHHIHEHARALQERFVPHTDRLTLVARNDDCIPGSPENPWGTVVDQLSQQVREHLGATHDLFVADFSTTGSAERVASQIVLLDAMQGYFEYELQTIICGIPAIALEGTPEDWERIEARVEALARMDLGLDWWLTPLRSILKRFPAASRGDVDARFWRSIFRIHEPWEMCSPRSFFGWVAVLFPYLGNGPGRSRERNPWLAGERDLGEMLDPRPAPRRARSRPPWWDPGEHGLFPRALPSGMASVPFAWKILEPSGDLRLTRSMELLGGLVGVRQDRASLALRPEIGWAVRERATP